ncbi:nonribosomal peptide synthase [Aspergillus sclerotioniger CBS 115572]|uniref:Nonribosomal peptide synthase n=1 Tax=Aspergillus sclerotioniger CBS 115572 TaxID=1450535 RepID=A0A317X457_9EURO|nr:nonribosomal peptide synthase [Aspergillus sclerotioniger CBS 115572]PWY91340.1 nonribosomal peptide synthase [Aspergillus sclerotioniger CBS 115572]
MNTLSIQTHTITTPTKHIPSTPPHETLPTSQSYPPDTDTTYICLEIPLPSTQSQFPSVARVCDAWRVVAALRPVLRMAIQSESTLAVWRTPEDSRFGVPEIHERNCPARCFLVGTEKEPKVYITILKALVDLTSLDVVRRDFLAFYLSGLMEPNRDRLVIRNGLGAGRDGLAAGEYWKKVLGGAPTAPLRTFSLLEGEQEVAATREISKERFGQVVEYADRLGVSVQTVMYCAWSVVLKWHTDTSQDAVIFTVAGREPSLREGDPAVGPFDQVYPLCLQVRDDSTIEQWVTAVDKSEREAAQHAFIGNDKIMQQAPNLSVQTGLFFLDPSLVETFTPNPQKRHVTVAISLQDGLTIRILGAAQVPSAKAAILLDHFVTAMEYITSNPSKHLGDLNMISELEKRQLIQWAEPLTDPVDGLVHRLVERQVTVTPDAPALQFENDPALTYDQLNRLANQLARQLPCGRGDYIPVNMRRSAGLVVVLLAILKAGAAYVTMDPDVPLERNQFIVDDVAAKFVVTDAGLAGTLSRRSITYEELIENAPAYEDSNPLIPQEATDVVYVIYTSGSTGKPKGVLLEHRAAVSGLAAFPNIPDLRQLLFHNPVFSAAQRSIWSTLKQGGCLCVASKSNLTVFIGDTINQMRINTIDVTPSTALLIKPGTVPCLRRMTVAGELINPALVPAWVHRLELLNAYGLSENTQFNWRNVIRPDQNPQNIGRPSDTTRAYVLMPGSTKLAPLLVPGELCLGGNQLARYYLNRPEKTAEAFIPNPFGPGRLYRTGDMVVMHEDGSVEMIGRIDFQIKVNDQRVEPGEANSIMQLHPGVRECWVVPAALANKKALVGTVVPVDGQDWNTLLADLRSQLQKALPLYMCPTYWVPMEKLPLNVNGKVDVPVLKRKVEAMSVEELLRTSGALETDAWGVQSKEADGLREIFAEVLKLSLVTLTPSTSLTAMGGSSMDAILISSRARNIGLKLAVPALLSGRTIVELAGQVTADSREEIVSVPNNFALVPEGVSIDSSDIEDILPATPLQAGLIVDSMLERGHYMYHQAYALGEVSVQLFQDAFQKVVNATPILRTRFRGHGASFLQIVHKSMSVPWETSSTSADDFIVTDRTSKGTFTESTPLIRAAAVKGNQVVIAIHHALYDHWSSAFILHDVLEILNGQPAAIRPRFKLFIQYLLRRDVSDMARFWKKYLHQSEMTEVAPAPGATGLYETVDLNFNVDEMSKLIGVRPASLLYAAWAITLSSSVGVQDVTFLVSLSGRDVPIAGIEKMAGPTLTTGIMRVEVDSEVTLRDFAEKVQKDIWEVSSHGNWSINDMLRAAELTTKTPNTLVNILTQPADNSTQQKIKSVPVPLAPSNGLLTLEMDAVSPNHIRMMSTGGYMNATTILKKCQQIFRSFTEPDTRVSDVVARTEGIDAESSSPASDSLLMTPRTEKNEDEAFQCIRLDEDCAPSTNSSKEHLLHHRFEELARSNGERIALQWELSRTVSYAELDATSARVASQLRSRGVQTGDTVVMLLEKSIEAVVIFLAILKAGAVYVPLAVENPIERNQFIIQHVDAAVILTHDTFIDQYEGKGREVVTYDSLLHPSTNGSLTLPTDIRPESLAYIIYTSGSTGEPKGVQITHAAASAAVGSMMQAEGRHRGKEQWRALQFANYAFDASIQDLANTLSSGGCLCMAPPDRLLSDLTGMIREVGATCAILTPTVADTLQPEEVPTLQTLILGGEPLTDALIARWAPTRTLLNVYGPTETSMVITTKRVSPTTDHRNIGAPLATVAAVVVNPETNVPVPDGEIGELCVAGPQVSAGYAKRDDLTAKAFVTSILPDSSLMYKTGDFVRWIPGGELEYHGRVDQQVKVAGHRIELGEIEAVIQNSDKTVQSVVLVLNVSGVSQLAACVIIEPGDDDGFEAPEVRQQELQEIWQGLHGLAYYMLPRYVFPMRRFPRLVSQKVDRKRLKLEAEALDPVVLRSYLVNAPKVQISEEAGEPPSTEQEIAIATAWASILRTNLRSVRRHSTFIALGGDSISAINMVNLVRQSGWAISVGNVLNHRTLREVAEAAEPTTTNAVDIDDISRYKAPETALQQWKSTNPAVEVDHWYPVPPGQAEFLEQGAREEQFWVLMVVRPLPETQNISNWISGVIQLTRESDILRSTFIKTPENGWVAAVLRHADPVFHFIDCTRDERQHVVDEIWQKRFRFGEPFVHYSILSYPDGIREVVVKMDHGLWDGTSLRLFDEHIAAILSGEKSPHREPFHRFAMHQFRANKARTLPFWLSMLPSPDRHWPSVPSPKISKAITDAVPISQDRLSALANTCGVTIPTVYQSAFQLWLAAANTNNNLTGIESAYDYLLAGRNVSLPNPQVINGTCANFLPLRITSPLHTTVSDYIAQTQQLFWEASGNGCVGLEEIYRVAGRDRWDHEKGGNQVMFLFQPFEPRPQSDSDQIMDYVVLPKSQVTMFQPYALVVEFAKAVSGHRVKVMYDERYFGLDEVKGIEEWIFEAVEQMCEIGGKGTIGEVLGSVESSSVGGRVR